MRAGGFAPETEPDPWAAGVVAEAKAASRAAFPPTEEDIAQATAEAPAPKEFPPGMLPGPPKPPAAPATYKALQKIHLRTGPNLYADTTRSIDTGATFRAVAWGPHEQDNNVIWLKTDADYEGGWMVDTGVAGKLAGKKVIKRIAGVMSSERRSAVLELSAVDNAEALPPGSQGSDSQGSEDEEPNDGGFERMEQQRAPVLDLLEDPKIVELCESMGIKTDDLKANPEFLRTVARSLYGDEVVS